MTDLELKALERALDSISKSCKFSRSPASFHGNPSLRRAGQ